MLLNCLLHPLGQGVLPESHIGRGQVDMFAVHHLGEMCKEQHCNLYTTFVDLTKDFNAASRYELWRSMSKFGCQDKFIAFVRQFHDGMHVTGVDDG